MKELFQELFNNLSHGVAVFGVIGGGRDFVLKEINAVAEKLEKIGRAECLGKSAGDLLRNAVEFDLIAVFRRVWTTGKAEHLPSRFWLRGAHINYVFKLPSGEIVAVYTDEQERGHMEREIQRRIDEIGKLMQELQRVNRYLKETQAELVQMGKLSAMGKMAAEMAHEINNPLGAIKVYIDGLKRDIESGQLLPSEAAKAFESIGKSVDHIAQTVHRMRFFSKRHDEKFEALDLRLVMADVLDMMRPLIQKDGIRLVEEYPQVPLICSGNLNMLDQLFTNLLLNARDAIKSKGTAGTITVTARREKGGAVTAVIADDGKGMDAEVKAQIFSPFFTTKESGTGLGLSIVKRILDLHNCRIGVVSAPESGSTFTISFPKELHAEES